MYAMSAPHDQFAHYNGGYPVDGNEAAADYSYQHDSTGYYYHTSQHHQQPPQMHGSGYAGYDEPTATMMMMSSIGAYQQQCYGRAMGDGGLPHHAHQQHDADHYPAARAAYGAGPALGPAPCVVCGVQQVPFHGAACTRRCRWFADGCCPQCGRGRASAATAFCSLGCAGEARQANWCVGCGVRQVIHGGTSCSAPHCAAVVARLAARFANTTTASAGGPAVSAGGRGGPRSAFGGVTTGRRGSLNSSHGSAASNSNAMSSTSMPSAAAGGKRRFEPHAVLAPNDKVASSVRQQLGSDLARRVAAVVKVGGASDARKAYTAYRNRVEGELNESCGIGAPKYGHGGEGNEHRRYLVLTSECGAAVAGSGAEPTFCGSANCGVCCFLEHGAAALLSRTHEGESASAAAAPGYRAYSTASSAATAAASLATSGPSAALVVARVTIGAPSFAPLPPQQNASSSSSTSERTHCVVDRRDTYDIATLPADVACVDPLFVVVLRGQQQQQ